MSKPDELKCKVNSALEITFDKGRLFKIIDNQIVPMLPADAEGEPFVQDELGADEEEKKDDSPSNATDVPTKEVSPRGKVTGQDGTNDASYGGVGAKRKRPAFEESLDERSNIDIELSQSDSGSASRKPISPAKQQDPPASKGSIQSQSYEHPSKRPASQFVSDSSQNSLLMQMPQPQDSNSQYSQSYFS